MKEKITIIGGGSWGSALSRILADNSHDVLIYDRNDNIVNEINNFHTNHKYLPEGFLPLNVFATSNLKDALEFSEILLLVVPTAVIREVLNNIKLLINKPKLFVNASKGIEPNSFKRVSEIVKEIIPSIYIKGFVALTGPSHAEEVIKQMLTTICSASENLIDAIKIQNIFSNNTYFRVYAVNDLIGAELGGALKNIYAIAAGILDGLGFGDNAKAGLICRSLAEICRIAIFFKAKPETLYGLTGVGDLIVTCTSKHSRNYQAGFIIGSGYDLKKALSQITMVVEGARTCLSTYQISQKYKLDTPIVTTIYNIIYLEKNPYEEISKLMNRSLKIE